MGMGRIRVSWLACSCAVLWLAQACLDESLPGTMMHDPVPSPARDGGRTPSGSHRPGQNREGVDGAGEMVSDDRGADQTVSPRMRTPRLTEIVPTAAPAGASITLRGEDLSGPASVIFEASSRSVVPVGGSDREAICPVPPLPPGPVKVWIEVDGAASNSVDFDITPTVEIEALLPNDNPRGAPVLIRGSGLSQVGRVLFDAVNAGFEVWSDVELVTRVPEGVPVGMVSVTVIGRGGQELSPDFAVLPDYPDGIPSEPNIVAGQGDQVPAIPPITGRGAAHRYIGDHHFEYAFGRSCRLFNGTERVFKMGPHDGTGFMRPDLDPALRQRRFEGRWDDRAGTFRFRFVLEQREGMPVVAEEETYTGVLDKLPPTDVPKHSGGFGFVLFSDLTGRQLVIPMQGYIRCVPGRCPVGGNIAEGSCHSSVYCCDSQQALECMCGETDRWVYADGACDSSGERGCACPAVADAYPQPRGAYDHPLCATPLDPLVCVGGEWALAEPCSESQGCSLSLDAQAGACAAVDPRCRDASGQLRPARAPFCLESERKRCSDDFLTLVDLPCQVGERCQVDGTGAAATCACNEGLVDGPGGCRLLPSEHPCRVANPCVADYPCVPASGMAYTCLGQRADYPMPDAPDHDVRTYVVMDRVSGLTWQRYASRRGIQTWEDANSLCQGLAEPFASGYRDWRLPTKIELESILSEVPSVGGERPQLLQWDPLLSSESDVVWTRSPVAMKDPAAFGDLYWGLIRTSGASVPFSASERGHVLCVRNDPGGPALNRTYRHEERYVADATTVTDRPTGMIWHNAPDGISRRFAEATTVCDQNGFRLPTRKELLTLVDPTRSDPAIDLQTFPQVRPLSYWSRTQHKGVTEEWWVTDFAQGATRTASASESHMVICVRQGT